MYIRKKICSVIYGVGAGGELRRGVELIMKLLTLRSAVVDGRTP